MTAPISFEEYLNSLRTLTPHVDPTASTQETETIREAVKDLSTIATITKTSLAQWVEARPRWVHVLGLIVGLSQEKLTNALSDGLNTSGTLTLARNKSAELIEFLDDRFDLIDMVQRQLNQQYSLADVLIARAGSRVTAVRAGAAGRMVEDKIEAIADDLGLTYATRTSFVGTRGQMGPADLVIPDSENALIVVAAKGFDSTGSKLSDAYQEIARMADVRQPRQFIMAVVDGIGWKKRKADLRRIHTLRTTKAIDGLYTVTALDQFRADLENAARLRGLI